MQKIIRVGIMENKPLVFIMLMLLLILVGAAFDHFGCESVDKVGGKMVIGYPPCNE